MHIGIMHEDAIEKVMEKGRKCETSTLPSRVVVKGEKVKVHIRMSVDGGAFPGIIYPSIAPESS